MQDLKIIRRSSSSANRGKKKDVNQHWHSDMTYNECPPKLTMLYALEAPELGGETAFSNQILAAAELSDGMREMLAGLRAIHSAAGLAGIYGADQAEAPRAEHPVIRTHDETSEQALYVCRAFTDRFTTWSREESRSVLDYLYQHSIRPEFQARHQWRPGDVVMWDNRCLLHFAVHDHGDDAATSSTGSRSKGRARSRCDDRDERSLRHPRRHR